MAFKINDHAELHRQVGRSVLVGAGLSLAGLYLPTWALGGLLTLAFGLAVAVPSRLPSLAWAMLWGCLGGAAAQLSGPVAAVGVAGAMAASMSRELSGVRRLAALGTGFAGALAGLLVMHSLSL